MAIDAVGISGSDEQLFTGVGTYHGFALREDTGSGAAKVTIYDNVGTGGTIIDVVNLLADETTREYYDRGIIVTEGVYVEIESGTVEGSIRLERG